MWRGELVGTALTRREVNGYYLGFCNEALWPLLHCFQDRLRLDAEVAIYRTSRAKRSILLGLLLEDDTLWIHDTTSFLLGRSCGAGAGPIGFFLHTPSRRMILEPAAGRRRLPRRDPRTTWSGLTPDLLRELRRLPPARARRPGTRNGSTTRRRCASTPSGGNRGEDFAPDCGR
jgi:hypothetical protein